MRDLDTRMRQRSRQVIDGEAPDLRDRAHDVVVDLALPEDLRGFERLIGHQCRSYRLERREARDERPNRRPHEADLGIHDVEMQSDVANAFVAGAEQHRGRFAETVGAVEVDVRPGVPGIQCARGERARARDELLVGIEPRAVSVRARDEICLSHAMDDGRVEVRA